MRKIFVKIVVLLFSAGAGFVVAVLVTSPFIGFANTTANDGPNFPPPLVAIGFFALPYGILLFPLQVIVTLYEFFRKKPLGIGLLIIGAFGGAFAGLLWYFVIKSSQLDTQMAFLLIGVAVIQALVVFGCHWLANNFIRDAPVQILEKSLTRIHLIMESKLRTAPAQWC